MQSFTSIDHAGRVDEIAAQLSTGGLGCEALLFADLTDVRWLTGFTGSNGWAVLRGGVLTVGTDGRYEDRARAETADSGAEVVALQRAPELHQALADLLQGGTVGLNPSSVDHATWSRLAATVDLRAIDSPVGVARQVKSDGEIERISAAAATADAALSDVEPMLRSAIDSPVTEADVRNELEYRMRLHGADDRSYNTIVAAGPDNAARPHHEVGYRTIVEGDTVVIDVGGLVDGYHSDMTRSYVIGEPTPQQRDIYDLVQQSQAAGLAALGDGVSARSVDSACRDVFVAADQNGARVRPGDGGSKRHRVRPVVAVDDVGKSDVSRFVVLETHVEVVSSVQTLVFDLIACLDGEHGVFAGDTAAQPGTRNFREGWVRRALQPAVLFPLAAKH